MREPYQDLDAAIEERRRRRAHRRRMLYLRRTLLVVCAALLLALVIATPFWIIDGLRSRQIPQVEEDISKATWVAKSSLPAFLNNTYPSIAEVFREARI